jgi:hypothetical protein
VIYCVWYPSGGFGHFLNAVLTLHGDNFVRPVNTLKFSPSGDSHKLDLVVPKYLHEHWPGGIEFLNNKNYCVLVDNGINNESDKFKNTFSESTVIKICYSDYSWPVVARTMIDKAMKSNIETELPVTEWQTDELWAHREKYFLFLRDHKFRHAWKPTEDYSIYVEKFYTDYEEFFKILNSIVKIKYCHDLWLDWRNVNARYIDPVETASRIISDIKNKITTDLTHITDVWTQAVVYYYIWITFGFEVLHNDYSNWFTNTNDIAIMLSKHGVNA